MTGEISTKFGSQTAATTSFAVDAPKGNLLLHSASLMFADPRGPLSATAQENLKVVAAHSGDDARRTAYVAKMQKTCATATAKPVFTKATTAF